MAFYTDEIIISPIDAEQIENYLTYEPENKDECQSENEPIIYTAKFDNGFQMDIQCCGVKYDPTADSNLSWTQAILYDEQGREVYRTEPDDVFFCKWEIEYGDDVYEVEVWERQIA